ncbi:MAG: peptidase M50 [Pseudomonadota bacterium]
MSELFSQHWYRVAGLKPQLNPSLRVARHRYRGQPWYVLHDPSNGRTHRVTPQTYQILGRMDGARSIDQIWNAALAQLRDAAPTQDELLQLIGQLHMSDVVRCDVPPDASEIFGRHDRIARNRRWASVKNPLAIRLPLWDPDSFLERAMPLVKPLVGWPGLAIWAALVLPALVLAGMNWSDLSANLSDRVLSAQNLVLLWLTFPVVKLLHELGHAFAAKVGGAQVHEIGIMLLVFSPVPYVDSSGATGFRSKWGRAGVGAAGMLVETALAAVALYLWLAVEPGLVRAVCFNVMLIAGVSTIVFNLNPLLKFDGYFILSDLIEMPNLAQRSQRFVLDAIDRHVFGANLRPSAPLQPGERAWLAFYAPLAACYRLFVMVSIALFIATQFFVVGIALALLAVAQGLVWPVVKGLRHLVTGDSLRTRRAPALAAVSVCALAAGLLLFAVPLPNRAMAHGVVWLPEDAHVRAQTSGFVRAVLRRPGEQVRNADVVLETSDRSLDAQVDLQQARVDELDIRLAAERFTERSRAAVTEQALAGERAALQRLQDESARHRLQARTDGRLILQRVGDLEGRFLRSGDIVGHIDPGGRRILRAVVPQEDIDSVRLHVRAVSVRVASAPETELEARIAREVPAGKDQLPSRALALEAGGPFAMDPGDPEGKKTLNRVFQFDIDAAGDIEAPVGTRVFVRFDLTPLPAGQQAWRQLRQLFLSRFDV